jgi:hypothetical protein
VIQGQPRQEVSETSPQKNFWKQVRSGGAFCNPSYVEAKVRESEKYLKQKGLGLSENTILDSRAGRWGEIWIGSFNFLSSISHSIKFLNRRREPW